MPAVATIPLRRAACWPGDMASPQAPVFKQPRHFFDGQNSRSRFNNFCFRAFYDGIVDAVATITGKIECDIQNASKIVARGWCDRLSFQIGQAAKPLVNVGSCNLRNRLAVESCRELV
jgi:hypothetical protein